MSNKNFKVVEKGTDKEHWVSRSVSVLGIVAGVDSHRGIKFLISKRGASSPDNVGKWQCTCGYLDWDENLNEAVVREVYEETGLKLELEDFELIGIMSDPGKDERQNVCLRYMAILDMEVLETLVAEETNTRSEERGGEAGEIEEIKLLDFFGDSGSDLEWAFDHYEVICSAADIIPRLMNFSEDAEDIGEEVPEIEQHLDVWFAEYEGVPTAFIEFVKDGDYLKNLPEEYDESSYWESRLEEFSKLPMISIPIVPVEISQYFVAENDLRSLADLETLASKGFVVRNASYPENILAKPKEALPVGRMEMPALVIKEKIEEIKEPSWNPEKANFLWFGTYEGAPTVIYGGGSSEYPKEIYDFEFWQGQVDNFEMLPQLYEVEVNPDLFKEGVEESVIDEVASIASRGFVVRDPGNMDKWYTKPKSEVKELGDISLPVIK